MYTPSDAEYASAWALEAKREARSAGAENDSLRVRVARLEEQVQTLTQVLLLTTPLVAPGSVTGTAMDRLAEIHRQTPTELQESMQKRLRDRRNEV